MSLVEETEAAKQQHGHLNKDKNGVLSESWATGRSYRVFAVMSLS